MRDRSALLDTIRGILVLAMLLYHLLWDLAYVCGIGWHFLLSEGVELVSQGILFGFLLLSGFCLGIGKHSLQRGIHIFLCAMLVTGVTYVCMPDTPILFGVLHCIGICMLLGTWLKHLPLRAIPLGLGCLFLFALTRQIQYGYIGDNAILAIPLPDWLYHGNVASYLGFLSRDFSSLEYCPLIPWSFLFFIGYALWLGLGERIQTLPQRGIALLAFLGKHALAIYLLHQPIFYGICLAIAAL